MTTTTQIPGYLAGTWDIDPVHSDVSFTVRHMMVSKVRGRFATFSGEIVTGSDVTDSKVTATIDATSIDTGNTQRDGHVRSADFFDVENHPTWTYRSTEVRTVGDDVVLDGELTIKGVTRSVPLTLEVNGFGPDAYGGTRAGLVGVLAMVWRGEEAIGLGDAALGATSGNEHAELCLRLARAAVVGGRWAATERYVSATADRTTRARSSCAPTPRSGRAASSSRPVTMASPKACLLVGLVCHPMQNISQVAYLAAAQLQGSILLRSDPEMHAGPRLDPNRELIDSIDVTGRCHAYSFSGKCLSAVTGSTTGL